MIAYLAGPIDGDDVDRTESGNWRTSLANLLAQRGIASFLPNHAYCVPAEPSVDVKRAVIHLNAHAIQRADVFIAYLDGPGRAIGTSREIEVARLMHRPVIVITSDGQHGRHFALYDCEVVPNLLEAAETALRFIKMVKSEMTA